MGKLILLVGTRGSGKSALCSSLARSDVCRVLRPSTTRARRLGETDDYDFVQTWVPALYAWRITFGQHTYGMRISEIESTGSNDVGVTVFEPQALPAHLTNLRELGHELVTVGLDTVNSAEVARLRVGEDATRLVTRDQLAADRAVVQSCDIVFSGTADVIFSAVQSLIALLKSRGGVLHDGTIRAFLPAGALLAGASPGQVQVASYDLTLGDEAWCGRRINLTSEDPTLEIPPYSYAIVSAREKARIPKFIAGRFDLKLSFFFNGIILSNGPQVDPGYRGALFCMLYNGRGHSFGIHRDDHFATIEFSTTTHVTLGYSGIHQDQDLLSRFIPATTAVEPGGEIVKLIDEKIETVKEAMSDRVDSMRTSLYWMMGSVIAVIAIVVAVVIYVASDAREATKEAQNATRQLSESGEEHDKRMRKLVEDMVSRQLHSGAKAKTRPRSKS